MLMMKTVDQLIDFRGGNEQPFKIKAIKKVTL